MGRCEPNKLSESPGPDGKGVIPQRSLKAPPASQFPASLTATPRDPGPARGPLEKGVQLEPPEKVVFSDERDAQGLSQAAPAQCLEPGWLSTGADEASAPPRAKVEAEAWVTWSGNGLCSTGVWTV